MKFLRLLCFFGVFAFAACAEPQTTAFYDDPYHPYYRMNRLGWIPDRSGRPTPSVRPRFPHAQASRHEPPHPVYFQPPKPELNDDEEDSDDWDDPPEKKKRRKPKRKPPPDSGERPPPEKPKRDRKPGRRRSQ